MYRASVALKSRFLFAISFTSQRWMRPFCTLGISKTIIWLCCGCVSISFFSCFGVAKLTLKHVFYVCSPHSHSHTRIRVHVLLKQKHGENKTRKIDLTCVPLSFSIYSTNRIVYVFTFSFISCNSHVRKCLNNECFVAAAIAVAVVDMYVASASTISESVDEFSICFEFRDWYANTNKVRYVVETWKSSCNINVKI